MVMPFGSKNAQNKMAIVTACGIRSKRPRRLDARAPAKSERKGSEKNGDGDALRNPITTATPPGHTRAGDEEDKKRSNKMR